MQERYRNDPWALLVGCILYNMVQGKRAQPIHEEFLRRFPEPSQLGLTYHPDHFGEPDVHDWSMSAGRNMIMEMIELFKPLGLSKRRAQAVYDMTVDFLMMDPVKNPVDIKELRGCGKYASDSFEIFVRGNLVQDVGDKELRKYVEWASALSQSESAASAMVANIPTNE